MPHNDPEPEKRRRFIWAFVALGMILLIGLGVMASNNWLPHTDSVSGRKFGWFGKEIPKNSTSSIYALITTTPTPQLSKEYIYAGSRLLAVEDANATAVPPTDLAVWRPSSGVWYVLGGPGSAQTYQQWGATTDKPAPGDYDGDGKTDFAIFRPSDGSWWVINSSTGSAGVALHGWGASTDIPVAGDFDGDGKTDFALWRPSPAGFWIHRTSDGGGYNVTFGSTGDLPAVADFDGDGKADVALYHNATNSFIWQSSRDGQTYTQAWGSSGDKPVPADYDGDGKADFATIHVETSTQYTWNIRRSSDGGTTSVAWGGSSYPDVPVPNDYDGDGKVDIAIWRPTDGSWWINQSTGGTRYQQWGSPGDIPVPTYYRR